MNASVQFSSSHTHEDLLVASLMEEALQDGDAGLPVLQLLAAIRSYYQARDFSHLERFGVNDGKAQRVLADLDNVTQSVLDIVRHADGSAGEFFVEASVNVRRVVPA